MITADEREKTIQLLKAVIRQQGKNAVNAIKNLRLAHALSASYQERSFPHVTLTEVQTREMRNAFFAGFYCAINEVGALHELNEDESVAVVAGIIGEIEDHIKGILDNWLKSN